MSDGVSGFDIICLSTNHWTGLPTSKQHLMSVFARSRRVLYVDPPIDVFSVLGRRRRWPKLRGLRQEADNLWVLSPVDVAVSSSPDRSLARYGRLTGRVARAARALELTDPVVWTFAPEHAACSAGLQASLVVYQAADDPAAMSSDPARTRELEREHITACDLVFVASEELLRARGSAGHVYRLPNAADRRHFSSVLAGDPDAPLDTFLESLRAPRHTPRELGALDGPVVLFGGAAYSWFDVGLTFELAALRPEWNIVLVGPTAGRISRERLPANVTVVGRKPYDDFPWYVAASDVGILPLLEGEFSRNCDPIVMYEFLICGKPVVATPFPAAGEHGTLVCTATTASGFAEEIEKALVETGDPDRVRERVEFGFSCTWEGRAEEALRRVSDMLSSGGRKEGPR